MSEHAPDIFIPASLQGGVWANEALVYWHSDEYTIDFVRYEPDGTPEAILVARVALSRSGIIKLKDDLHAEWTTFMRSTMPPEAHAQEEDEA